MHTLRSTKYILYTRISQLYSKRKKLITVYLVIFIVIALGWSHWVWSISSRVYHCLSSPFSELTWFKRETFPELSDFKFRNFEKKLRLHLHQAKLKFCYYFWILFCHIAFFVFKFLYSLEIYSGTKSIANKQTNFLFTLNINSFQMTLISRE